METLTIRPEEAKLFEGQPSGFPFGDFDIEDVMLPEDDDMGIPSDDDVEEEEEVHTESGFGNIIAIDNLPKVSADKFDKLVGVVKRITTQVGTIRDGGFLMPVDEATGISKGFAFVELLNAVEAQAAKEQITGYALDKNHKLVVNMFDDFERYFKVPDTYQAPPAKEYTAQENQYEFLLDERGRDQFVIRWGDNTEVFWNDPQRAQAEEVYKRINWTESYVQWAPQGNLLATVHRQGVASWGGPSFGRLNRYSHPGVRLIDFSPGERFLVSYSSKEPATAREKATLELNVFDVRSGRKLRNFAGSIEDYVFGAAAGPGGGVKWPIFKWAGGCDDKYFARLQKNAISVYETPDMGLLDKKSLKLEGVKDFSWSPSEPIIAAYQTEQGNLPARVSLIRFPDRTELRQKNLFSVFDTNMYWHPQGDYLAIKVDRYTKTRKSTYTSFELFSMKERDIPMEVLELPSKTEKIIDFAWEPKGCRFALLHGDDPRGPSLSIYAMKDMKATAKGVVLVGSVQRRTATNIYWSPQGRFLLLAGLKSFNGQLDFFDADEMATITPGEHFQMTDVAWDPTGRFVACYTSYPAQMENGYSIYSFNGTKLYSLSRDRFFQFSWRPRHASLLTPEKEEEIRRNLKDYSKGFEEQDRQLLNAEDAATLAERRRIRDEWDEYLASKREWLEEVKAGMRELLGEDALEEGEYTVEEIEVEETIHYSEEVIKT